MQYNFNSPQEAIQFLADRTAALSDRIIHLEMRVEGYKAALIFLKHVCIRQGVETAEAWNELISGFASSTRQRGAEQSTSDTSNIIADAVEELLFDPDEPAKPALTIIDGGRPD